MDKFRTSLSGYNKEDVNKFVADVIKQYESILQKLKDSNTEMQFLSAELKKYKELEKNLNDTIVLAQETSANAHKAAVAEGKLIIEEAKKNASKIVNNSLLKAQSIEKDAEELKRRVTSYKRRFTTLVESQIDEINQFDDKM